jgi:hypothetical protein
MIAFGGVDLVKKHKKVIVEKFEELVEFRIKLIQLM